MKRLALIAMVVASGCQAQPRSASFFEAHPEETARVLVACAQRAQRGTECDTAREGQAAIERNARMELYRRSFK